MPSFLVECKTKMAAPSVDQQRNAAVLPSALWPNDKIAKIDLNCSLCCCCCSSCLCLPPPPSSHHSKHHHHSSNHSSSNSFPSVAFIFFPFICFFIFIVQSVHGHHWPSLQAAQARFPGCCPLPESFDCGNGTCLSVSRFHDGQPDCHDGSDEFCLPGQIPCGRFCADLLHLGECLRNPNCTKEQQKEGTDQQNLPLPPIFCPLLKRRLCGVVNTISCRGYGECIFVKWLMDGKRDCLDGSDEDAEYAGLFKVTPVREDAEIDEKEKGHPKGPQSSASPLPPGAKSGERTSSRVQSKSTTMRMRTPSKWREGEGQGGGNWPEEEDWSKESPMDGDESKFGVGNGRRTTIMMGRGGGGKEEDGRGRKEENGGKLKLVESTEPGPWQNPPLDDFGGEFARFLITPSTTNPTIKTTTTITQNAKSRLMTGAAGPSDKHIIFPNWPEEEKEEREWKKEPKEGGNWPMTTPKYPFDRGKIVGREEEMKSAEEGGGEGGAEAPIWVPIPFSRPATRTTRTTERTTTKRGEGGKEWKWKTIEGSGWRNNKEDEEEEGKDEFKGTTQKTEIWMPEILPEISGGKVGMKEEEERKPKMKEGKEGTEKSEEHGRGGKPAEEVISEEEGDKKDKGKGKGQTEEEGKKEKEMEEEEEEGMGRRKTTVKNEGEEELESTTIAIATTTIITTTTTEELSHESPPPSTALPSPSIPALSSIHPLPPIHPAEIMPMPKTTWLMPITDAALSSVIASMSGPHAALLNCTQRVLRIMDKLAPSQSATRCQCPAGQMRQANGQCQMAPISTFRARLDSLCGIRKLDFLPEEQLVFLKTSAAIRDRPICIRDVLDGPLIVMNSVCEVENNCSIDEMNQKVNAPDVPLPEIKLKIGELSGGACGHFDLNDCEEKAECIPQGLRYQCRCLPGTNDTLPQHPGRFCEGTVISKSCVKFLGVCVLVWLLMLLLLCILLPTIGYFCLKHCYKKSPTTQEAVERRWRWLKGKILRKEPSLLPIITTSTAPSGSQRRESGAAGTEMAGADFGHTLKVPSMIEGQKPSYIIPPVRQQTQTDSEEYLIMEEDEEGGAEGEIVPEEERDQIKRDSSEKTEEEGGGGGGTGGKVTKSQTLDEEEAGAMVEELGGRKGTGMRMEEEEGKKEAEKEGEEQPVTEPAAEPGRPPSVTSRAGTPTIWDQFRILGDQYSRLVDIEERRESKNSLEELMNKAKEKERAEDVIRRKEERREVEDLDETIKDDLDAELKMAGGRGENGDRDEEADKGGEGGLRMEVGRGRWRGAVDGEEEPGRSIPTLGPGLLPPGAIRIGFGGFHDYDSEDLDMGQRPRRRIGGQLPPPPSTTSPPQLPRRQFVPKQLGARHPPMGRTLTSGSTIVKGPAPAAVADGQRRVAAKGEFVVIRGRRVEERKREKKERAEAEERRDKRKRIMGQMRQQQRVAEEESTERLSGQREFPRPRDSRIGEEFDPDLPTTSQAEPHWQKSLRHPKAAGEHSAEYLRQRFRQHQHHGQALASIEEQIEKRVHSGCIVGGRKPWDVSPRADQLQQEWMGRELTQSDYGGEGGGGRREGSLERIESRVHSGCITDRKPWNSSTWKPDGDNIQRGHSDWDLSTRRKHKEAEEKQMTETTRMIRRKRDTSSLERRKGEIGNGQKWLEYD